MRKFRLFAVLLVLIAAVGLATADTLMVQKTHVDSFMGQPAKDSTSKTWIGKGMARTEDGDSIVILRLDRKKMYLVDTKAKKVSVIDLPIDMSKMMPPEMAKMMAQMKPQVSLRATGETRKINQWNAQGYELTMKMMGQSIVTKLWATKDIKIDMQQYDEMIVNMQGIMPTMADMVKEMAKMDGVMVLSETTSPMKSRTELVSVEETAAPAGTYEVPAGYKEEAFDMMKQMQGAH